MKTSTRETIVIVGTTTVQVVANNPNRVALVIMNRSDTSVSISTDAGVLTTTGFRLGADTGSVTFTKRDFGVMPSRQWFAISSANTKTIVVQETIKISDEDE